MKFLEENSPLQLFVGSPERENSYRLISQYFPQISANEFIFWGTWARGLLSPSTTVHFINRGRGQDFIFNQSRSRLLYSSIYNAVISDFNVRFNNSFIGSFISTLSARDGAVAESEGENFEYCHVTSLRERY